MANKILSIALIMFSVALAEQKAHLHGVGELDIALSKNQLEISLDTPTDNIFGFEHKPKTKKERKIFKAKIKQLKKANLVTITKKAQCVLIDTDIDVEYGDSDDHDDHNDKHDHDDHDKHDDHDDHDKHDHDDDHDKHESSHSDLEAEYKYKCKYPQYIKNIDAKKLFAEFGNFEKIKVRWINNNKQGAKDISPKDTIVKL